MARFPLDSRRSSCNNPGYHKSWFSRKCIKKPREHELPHNDLYYFTHSSLSYIQGTFGLFSGPLCIRFVIKNASIYNSTQQKEVIA